MRYLNRIIFVNSASVKYAEIGLDGNVHLIGTQGVGKSTLLRAVLFFYNADKSKLGIPKEKKRFDDYYFEYQNSYIIYEIVKGSAIFCVLAYKVNGKVVLRFFNSKYKKSFFIDNDGSAFDGWDKTRNALGEDVYYTKIISSYDEYRKILYGDNKGLRAEFRKYALIESKQYQNIPRTIQNVLLNSNLEAKFIKDTIIKSISEDEFKIDIENYSKNHLRDFEMQIQNIKVWSKEDKEGQIRIKKQANIVIDNHRSFNFIKGDREKLAKNLSSRMNYIKRERANFLINLDSEKKTLNALKKKKEKLNDLHRKREQRIISEIDYIKKELKKSKDKKDYYKSQNIEFIIEKVAEKESLISEEKSKLAEKELLTSEFSEMNQKYNALLLQVENQQKKFNNGKNEEIIQLKDNFGDVKLEFIQSYDKLIEKIKLANQDEEESKKRQLKSLANEESGVKNNKAELKHKVFFANEIEKYHETERQLKDKIFKIETLADSVNSQVKTARKEWELESGKIEQTALIKLEKEQKIRQTYLDKVLTIEKRLKQDKSSFYGWLNDNVSNWENTIGKVVDAEEVLFNASLNPKQVTENKSTFFGIELNLNAIGKRTNIKTVDEFNREIVNLRNKIVEIEGVINAITENKDNSISNLTVRFKKKINTLKNEIKEGEYTRLKNKEKLRVNVVNLEEWREKSDSEKRDILKRCDIDLEKLFGQRKKIEDELISIEKRIRQKVSKKEREKSDEIKIAEDIKNKAIEDMELAISNNNATSQIRIQELERQQGVELGNKGADTKRLDVVNDKLEEVRKKLDFIKNNEAIVSEYGLHKKELFDRVPQFNVDKSSLESKQAILMDNQEIEQKNFSQKINNQDVEVQSIEKQVDEFNRDLEGFEQFKKSDAFPHVQKYFLNKIGGGGSSQSAVSIISELNANHYKNIEIVQDLRQSINIFIGNFDENNIFKFKVKFNENSDLLNFATELKEFIEEDKISEFKNRVNERFVHIIQLIGNETTELQSKEAEIEKVIRKINNDFVGRNFVEAIKKMEMRTQESSNPVVRLLIKIKEFNDENSLILGGNDLFTSSNTKNKNNEAIELLKQLVKELEKYKNSALTLSESFDLQFKIIENDNDSGWVEKLSNVGSEGTDVLVKAMINILLLNVFKNGASKKFQDFKLHCMMDEIGRLHPNNVKGILRFANERNILLINGSPISQNPIDYKYTYKLSKEQSKASDQKYITKITRLVKVIPKVVNQ